MFVVESKLSGLIKAQFSISFASSLNSALQIVWL